jgi:hypothetical protein
MTILSHMSEICNLVGRIRSELSQQNMYPCYFVRIKSHIIHTGIYPGSPKYEARGIKRSLVKLNCNAAFENCGN